ncbi:MAG: hypothetical protein QXM07_08170 [Nitrososphaerota archaeon]
MKKSISLYSEPPLLAQLPNNAIALILSSNFFQSSLEALCNNSNISIFKIDTLAKIISINGIKDCLNKGILKNSICKRI